MAFIEKQDPVVVNIKLTSQGRYQLSTGNLDFKYFAIGDSEIDYNFNTQTGLIPFNARILRPTDTNPNIISFIPRNLSGDPYNAIGTVPSAWYPVINTAPPQGFFNSGSTTFIVNSDHVKQPDGMIYMSGITGANKKTVKIYKAPTYGTSGNEPAIGDILLVKWTLNANTTGYTINKNQPTPYLIYQISGKTGTLAGNNLVVTVDRNLPNFSGYTTTAKAGAMIYYNYINYSGSTIFNTPSTEYLDESVLTFLQNSQCPTVVFPFWNMSIIYTDEIAGVQLGNKTFKNFDTVGYGGFVSYIQQQAPVYKKLGVIHYTNNSPANVYAEGFYLKTPQLSIPTIMWHKSTGKTLGVTLKPIGAVKMLTGATKSLNVEYYDLADPSNNIVGKVFTDLKIFVIEDQELLFAMSYKANRSWTLPNYNASIGGGGCTPPPAAPISFGVVTVSGTSGFGSIITGGKSITGGSSITSYGMYYRKVGDLAWTKQSVTGSLPIVNSFSMTLSGLLGLTGYQYYAFIQSGTTITAVGATGTTITKSIPSVQTTLHTSISTTTIGGTGGNSIPADVVSGVTNYAMQYKTVASPTWLFSPTPVTSGSPGGPLFTRSISGLTPNTSYNYRAWIQVNGIQYNGTIQTVNTSVGLPTVTTKGLSGITTISGTSGGNVVNEGGASVTQRGVVYGLSPNPTTANTTTINGSGPGSYLSKLIGLTPNTTYHIRAYAKNISGVAYGGNESGKTATIAPVVPTVTTNSVTELTSTSVETGGNVISIGSSPVTARGIVWNTTGAPTVPSNLGITIDGSGLGGFASIANGLSMGNYYYFRAYATNAAGTGYGAQQVYTIEPSVFFSQISISGPNGTGTEVCGCYCLRTSYTTMPVGTSYVPSLTWNIAKPDSVGNVPTASCVQLIQNGVSVYSCTITDKDLCMDSCNIPLFNVNPDDEVHLVVKAEVSSLSDINAASTYVTLTNISSSVGGFIVGYPNIACSETAGTPLISF
jgi:hypothetical protein